MGFALLLVTVMDIWLIARHAMFEWYQMDVFVCALRMSQTLDTVKVIRRLHYKYSCMYISQTVSPWPDVVWLCRKLLWPQIITGLWNLVWNGSLVCSDFIPTEYKEPKKEGRVITSLNLTLAPGHVINCINVWRRCWVKTHPLGCSNPSRVSRIGVCRRYLEKHT